MADEDEDFPPIKIVVVGDGAVGKTCLLEVFSKGEFPTAYVPTVFNNTTKDHTLTLDGEETTVQFELWDTAGQEDLDRLRPLSYRSAAIFLICFSVMHPASFENLEFKWIPEIEHHRRKMGSGRRMGNDDDQGHDGLIVLCGTKSDLRNDDNALQKLAEENKKPVSRDQINNYIETKLMTKLKNIQKNVPYVETSALKMTGVNEAFEEGLKLFLKSMEDSDSSGNLDKPSSGCCTLL